MDPLPVSLPRGSACLWCLRSWSFTACIECLLVPAVVAQAGRILDECIEHMGA